MIFLLILLLSLVGCATQKDNLLSTDCERVSTGAAYYLRCSREVVDRRCTQGKTVWDDGSAYDPTDESKWARCCTVFPRPGRPHYRIYVTKGEEECLVHEFGHVEIFEADGGRVILEHHKRLHNFGFGKPKRRL